jgi:predicted transcriptional regulator
MSKTVSFRSSEELDEFLEQEAERRMTTKSTVAQMLLAERVREIQAERSGGGEEADQSEPGEVEEVGRAVPEVFDRHSDHWYEPDSDKYDFVVYLPGHEERKYYKTAENAAKRLRKEYDD